MQTPFPSVPPPTKLFRLISERQNISVIMYVLPAYIIIKMLECLLQRYSQLNIKTQFYSVGRNKHDNYFGGKILSPLFLDSQKYVIEKSNNNQNNIRKLGLSIYTVGDNPTEHMNQASWMVQVLSAIDLTMLHSVHLKQ